WAGITPNAQLAKIKQDIDLDLVSSLGFGVDKKFLPHLTLARTKKNSQSVATLARKFEGRLFGRFMVTDLILYQSKLQPTGVIHTPLEVITLKKSQDPALE
ncbi:MAG: hypothetical protein LBE31_11650, partial [Deltaproteobacteria bacterium]|nr:hypothetical protein [Deltaproteobacteria bacterium]